MSRIWLSPPHISSAEQQYVQEAFTTNWIAPLGANVTAFEKQLSDFTGRFTLAVSSGTAAMHLALVCLNIQAGDFVFCQSLTFAGCAFPVLYQGATPVFIDSEASSWNMDPDLLEEALKKYTEQNKKPKAIIVVHIYGMPAEMKRIQQLAAEYEVPVIEDAAEAVGSVYDDVPCGSMGDMAIYSFNGNKIITTSGGGALIAKRIEYIQHARKLSDQAKENFLHYEHSQTGYNYRLSNICAGIGRGQMEVLAERVERKRENFQLYSELLSSISFIQFQQERAPAFSNRWLTVMNLQDHNNGGQLVQQIQVQLQKQEIESRPVWKPMHSQPVFKNAPSFINGVSDSLFQNGLCLPSGTALTNTQIKQIVSIVERVVCNEEIVI
ncbi:MAG: aminotransferase class I/II-fold pyridoxal phosphate-dependent enzyme [Chitinophagaceae bacterium]|nr:aminotransferase class I/II-fold pyridoxal phosphate-dependent enzyme [Chitinophagaceae bacterium]